MRRYYFEEPLDGSLARTLSGKPFHYLINVLRLKQGDRFAAGDSAGVSVLCTVEAVRSATCSLTIDYNEPSSPREQDLNRSKKPRITLFQCLPKGTKFDTIVRQATECGVFEIVPVESRFCVARISGPEKLRARTDRWRRIVTEALQQSGGKSGPAIRDPIAIIDIPDIWKKNGPAFVFHQERLDTASFHGTLAQSPDRVAICIGPEGGFATEEIESLRKRSFVPLYLGNHILRSETAALYAIAAVQVVTAERHEWQSEQTLKV